MIVVVGGVKGGSGKTTVATNLTVMRALQGYKVLLVDADEQRSASSWTDQREANGFEASWSTIQLGGENVGSQIQKMMKNYQDIIVDVGGRNTISQRSAIIVADIYLVPFLPRSLDIWTLGQVKSIIASANEINPNLKSYALINRGDSIGPDNKDAIDIISDCPHLTCIPVIIGQRKAFANAATDGLGVVELKTSDKKAIHEMMMLYEYIYK
jgi:chromosome partitioning protein